MGNENLYGWIIESNPVEYRFSDDQVHALPLSLSRPTCISEEYTCIMFKL